MNVLVTGATGHIGRAVVSVLARRGHKVAAVVRDRAKAEAILAGIPNVTLIESALEELTAHAIKEEVGDVAGCIHLAWSGVATASQQNASSEFINARVGMKLLDVLAKLDCKTFVGIGSQAEYGLHEGAIDENAREAPITPYGIEKLDFKRKAEAECLRHGFRYVWLRVFSTYGVGDVPSHLLPMVITKFLDCHSPELTECRQVWDFLNVKDCALAIALALEMDHVHGVYNVGSGKPVILRDVIELIREELGPGTVSAIYGAIEYRRNQVMHLQAEIGKISRATGWDPAIDVENGMREYVGIMRMNRGNANA